MPKSEEGICPTKYIREYWETGDVQLLKSNPMNERAYSDTKFQMLKMYAKIKP